MTLTTGGGSPTLLEVNRFEQKNYFLSHYPDQVLTVPSTLTTFPLTCFTVPFFVSSATRSVKIQPTLVRPSSWATRFTAASRSSSSSSMLFFVPICNTQTNMMNKVDPRTSLMYKQHCSLMTCIALHCTALHCTALHCTALHCTALHAKNNT